jgi:ATP-dependent exoDNAse (exonuclease V) beta subunit
LVNGIKKLCRLQRDDELTFPHFYVVNASAGSGKTYLLSLRFCQFILSERIQNNNLTNILALTFTKNAANEMRQRILEWLKRISLGLLDDSDKENLKAILSLPFEEIVIRSRKLIGLIFDNFSEFQVSTIDSFMARIFKVMPFETNILASNIRIDVDEIIDFAVDKFIQEVDFYELEKFLENISLNNSLSFNPKEDLKKNLLTLLDLENKRLGYFKDNKDIEIVINEVKYLMKKLALIAERALEKNMKLTGKIKKENFYKLIDKLKNSEINIIKTIKNIYKNFPFNKETSMSYSYLKSEWEDTTQKIYSYLFFLCQLKFQPYINLFNKFKPFLNDAYRSLGSIYIGNINKLIYDNLNSESITKIQFCLGGYIYHILLDEFQDTDEVQWACLKKICDDLLTRNGSVFTVGDIKQSIYSFRGSNYKIMKEVIEKPIKNTFLLNLENNFRTDGIVLESIRHFFQDDLKERVLKTNNLSGLSNYIQYPLDARKDSGFFKSKIVLFDESEISENSEDTGFTINCLKNELLNLIHELEKRYELSDIAILARSNLQVNEIASWLIESGFNIVSESSLDIRDRKIIQEIVAFLKFLESPFDNLSFSIFLLGNIMNKIFSEEGISTSELRDFIFSNRCNGLSLYTLFKDKYNKIWNEYFREIYIKSGYVAMFDLFILIYSTFKIPLNFPEESAYLVKLLDIISEIESTGYIDINNFLYFFEKDKSELFEIEIANFTDAIRLMTIHKAKGLEFPVVINIVDLESNYAFTDKRKSNSNLFVYSNNSDSKESENLMLLNITRDIAQKNELLDKIYCDNEINCIADDLNLLYVAMTRAKFELYNFFCVKSRELIEKFYHLEKEIGQKKGIFSNHLVKSKFDNLDITFNCLTESLTVEKNCSRNDIRSIKRGVLLHNIFKKIKYKEDLKNLEEIIQLYKPYIELFEPDIRTKISSIVLNENFSRYFSSSNSILTEVDFIDKRGKAFRLDRIVLEKDIAYAIDYKSGLKEYYKSFERDTYYKQIKQYMNIVKTFYKIKTIGVILDIDNISQEIIYDE